MGCGPSTVLPGHAEAETMVPEGADVLRASFLLCLKVDVYQAMRS